MDSLFQSICTMLHGIEEYHDSQTMQHESRTGKLMELLGEAHGLDERACNLLCELGSIHDIGKISIPQSILEKPGPLTQFERNIVRMHPQIGFNFINKVKHPYAEFAATIILCHHENFDGSGYPNGLKGNEIKVEAAICSICDVYDALREARPYREKKSHQEVLDMMYDPGPHGLYHKFNPKLMKSFKKISDKIQNFYQ